MNPYEVLGVEVDAPQSKIKKAFREKSKKLHPDTSEGDSEAFNELKEAYDMLSDDSKRKQYDMYGEHNIEQVRTLATEIFKNAYFKSRNRYFTAQDMNEYILEEVSKMLGDANGYIRNHNKEIKHMNEVKATIEKAPHFDFLTIDINKNIAGQEAELEKHTKLKKLVNFAKDLLLEYEFKSEEPKENRSKEQLRVSALSKFGYVESDGLPPDAFGKGGM